MSREVRRDVTFSLLNFNQIFNWWLIRFQETGPQDSRRKLKFQRDNNEGMQYFLCVLSAQQPKAFHYHPHLSNRLIFWTTLNGAMIVIGLGNTHCPGSSHFSPVCAPLLSDAAVKWILLHSFFFWNRVPSSSKFWVPLLICYSYYDSGNTVPSCLLQWPPVNECLSCLIPADHDNKNSVFHKQV